MLDMPGQRGADSAYPMCKHQTKRDSFPVCSSSHVYTELSLRIEKSFALTRGSPDAARINAKEQRPKAAVTISICKEPEGLSEQPCLAGSFAVSSARPMAIQFSGSTRAIFSGFIVIFLQLFLAIVLLAPEGPFEYRYQTLVQHDGYWFGNIVDRGYETIVPPLSHKVMEVSNTGFFPPIRPWRLSSTTDLA